MGTKASRRLARKPSLPAAKPEPLAVRVRQEPGKTNLRREAKGMGGWLGDGTRT